MVKEDYVSFGTAKLLKEKGFDEFCHALYHEGDDKIFFGLDVDSYHNTNLNVDCYACPTLQMTMKWLREMYNIYIMIDKDFATENGWHYVVVRKQDWTDNIDNGLAVQESNSYTYEFACEAAIKYCLENLI